MNRSFASPFLGSFRTRLLGNNDTLLCVFFLSGVKKRNRLHSCQSYHSHLMTKNYVVVIKCDWAFRSATILNK